MAEYEYEEENLDEFMINASSILSKEDNPDKETIIESLKQHLSSISDDKSEMQSFFKTLNLVILDPKTKKITHKEAFKLYPIIFSFNPNSSFYYIDFFLFSINECSLEENRSNFAYLSIIFSEVVLSFFSDEKSNTNLIEKNYLLDSNKKNKLYEKLLNFCNEKIKTNKKAEQSFGCLLLTELIEKCPIVTEEKYLDDIFKIISNYLEDRFFICKLDLLNCTISLIFTSENKFRPYANICLFRVLDYLTDDDWMKRKLAINIVYTLIFYCKDEIMAVKENIVEFLDTLKEDSVEEVREVCIQTLKFIEENEKLDSDKKEKEKEKEIEKDITNDNKNINININENANNNIINENLDMKKNIKEDENNNNNNKDLKSNENKIKRKKNEITSNKKNKKVINKPKNNINKVRSEREINYNNETKKENEEENKNDDKNETNNTKMNIKYNRLMMKKKANEDYIKKQLLKEKYHLEKIEKELNEKTKNSNYSNNIINNKKQQKPQFYRSQQKKNKAITIAKLIKDFPMPDSMNKDNSSKKENINNEFLVDNNINKNNENENKLSNDEQFKSTLNGIFNQLNEIQKEQNQFLSILNNLQNSVNANYSNLNERILALEKHFNVNSEED